MELKDYQRKALEMLEAKPRLILAIEMGCGKTAVAIHFTKGTRRNLVIVPSNKTEDWKNDYKKWFPDSNPIVYPDPHPPSDYILIVSIDTLARDNHFEIITNLVADCVIVDEAHLLKSATSKKSTSIVPFVASIPRIALLTGTPQLNRPAELYNLLYMIDPRKFRSRRQFAAKYCAGKVNAWGVWEERGASSVSELNLVVQEHIFRITKKEALPDLPPKTRVVCKMTHDDTGLAWHTRRYQQLCSDHSAKKTRKTLQALVTHIAAWWRATGVVKAKIWCEQFAAEMLAKGKSIIWCYHTNVAEYLHDYLRDKLGVTSILVTGTSANAKKRSALFDPLRDPEHPIRVAICTLGSCSSGLTVIGPTQVIFVELYFTPAIMHQAEDRVHRLGTTEAISVHWMELEDSYDQLLLRMIRKKDDLFTDIISQQDTLQDTS